MLCWNTIIKPVCEKNGYEVIRADQLKTVDRIDHTIIEYLETAELVIADMTDHNAKLFTNLDIDKLQTFLLYRLSKKGKYPIWCSNLEDDKNTSLMI